MGGGGHKAVPVEDANWAEIGEKLIGYALWLIQHRVGSLGRFDDVGLGRSVEDLACEVMADVLEERCNYDPSKGELVPYLKRRLKWHLLNLLDSSANQLEYLVPGAGERSGQSSFNNAEIETFVGALRKRIDEFQKERKRKFDLHPLLNHILEEPDVTPQRLAEKMSLDTSQVYYQLRMLRRLTLGLKQGGRTWKP